MCQRGPVKGKVWYQASGPDNVNDRHNKRYTRFTNTIASIGDAAPLRKNDIGVSESYHGGLWVEMVMGGHWRIIGAVGNPSSSIK